MATAPKQFNKGSDEIRNHDCGVCLSNSSTVEAISYCTTCCEYMCRSCDMAHGTFKATKIHKVFTGIDMPIRRVKPTLPFMFCDTHKTTILNIYCTTHNEVICHACKMNSHINCDTGDVSRYSGRLDVDKEHTKIAKDLADITTRYEDLTKNRHIDKSTVMTQIQKCLSDLHQFRKDINDKLDKEEKKLSSEMRNIEETMTKEIDGHAILADGILCQLGDLDKSLSECQKTLENDVKFVGIKRVASRSKEYRNILSNVQKDMYPIDIRFQPNHALTGIIRQVHALGTVNLRNRPAINIPAEDLELTPIENANDFTLVIHGTDYEAWENIKKKKDEDPLIFLSRTLLSILRHNAEKLGFSLMKGGFLYVDEILYWTKKLRGYTEDDVMRVVRSNDKHQFTIEQEEDGRLKIRANQGHTLQVEDLDLQPIDNADYFPLVIHGTYYEAWEHIKRTGLSRMKRNYIYFAPGEPGQGSVISGIRSSCQVMIYLDLDKALKDGLKFFISSNNVILCTGDRNGSILPRYFAGAKDRLNGYRLDFDPNIAGKSDKKGQKMQKEK